MKHPGFAPLASLTLLFIPPVLLFSLACYLADKFNLDRLPGRQFLPLMMWLALAIGVGHCVVLSVWAATCLRRQLRSVAMSRYQPLPPWRWRLPSRRTVRRFALATAVSAAVVALLAASYYGYQNWRSQRAWRNFQAALKQRGESLSISPLLPGPVPDDANFARSPAFRGLLGKTNRETTGLLERMDVSMPPSSPSGGNNLLLDWRRQAHSPLQTFASAITMDITRMPGAGLRPVGPWGVPSGGSVAKRQRDAEAILLGLESQDGVLQELAAAAARLPSLQTSTNRDALAVLHPAREPALLLERLHLLFQVRACASLALGRDADAAEDVLAGLRLARLARQLPDARSTVRVQLLLARSLQPLWEGLSQQAWTEPQLAAFQQELAGFNLLTDYTNALRRVLLAHIEAWRAIPDSGNPHPALPAPDADYLREPAWRLQPRTWWYDSCLQLYYAGRYAIEQVDFAAGRIQPGMNWSDLEGLPLDPASRELFLQSSWWNAEPVSVAFVQTSVNQATVACALERFHMANGAYPGTLEQLVPALLARVPSDAVSGRPLIYQPVSGGNFILRGVGSNGIDDRNQKSSDDWLWTFPTNAPSVKK